jgi:uncharacterized protein
MRAWCSARPGKAARWSPIRATTRNEYIYKFVSARPFARATANGSLLDDGTLYVAKFNADGSGEWLPLVHGQGPLTAGQRLRRPGRGAGEHAPRRRCVGATKMDRPEWGAVDPRDGRVYFTLTNNTRRTPAQVDGPNPRAENLFGQIVRWREANDDHAATRFAWDLFVIAGPTDNSRIVGGAALTADNIFACPDGLWFDPEGRLWIQTDIGERSRTRPAEQFGNNAMLCANPITGEIRRFLTGPTGQEITGVITTPDGGRCSSTSSIRVPPPRPRTSPAGGSTAAGRMAGRACRSRPRSSSPRTTAGSSAPESIVSFGIPTSLWNESPVGISHRPVSGR